MTGGATLLAVDDLVVPTGGHTAVLGPNGAGKTTLLRLLSGHRFPTTGTVEVLGHRLGRVDLRTLRRRLGVVSAALDPLLDRGVAVRDLVAGALHGLTGPGRRQLPAESRERADAALGLVGARTLGDRTGGTLSVGEWQRVLLARALVLEPALLLLDEPCVGLDLAQRAHFLAHLDAVLTGPDAPTGVVVTHHLEELPRAVEHAVLLREGRVVAAGTAAEALTDATVSAAYGLEVAVGRTDGRWHATARSASG